MKKKTLFSFIYIGLTFIVIALVLIFGGTSFEEIGNALKDFNIWWMLACIGALLLFWLTDAWLLHDITSYMYKPVPFRQSLKVGIIGLYYSALTPSSTGGQPMQVMYMKRDKIPVGTSTCIVGIKFVVFELSLCTIYIIGMILRGVDYYNNNNDAFWLAALGFAINLVAVVIIILSIVNRKLIMGIGNWIIRVFSKIRVIKNKEQTLLNYKNTIDEYHTAASYISRYKLRAFCSYLISALNLAFLFIIPYLIYLSLCPWRSANIVDFFIMESFLNLAVSFFPLPGAAGASEGGFMLFFDRFFINPSDPKQQVVVASLTVAMLIWRFLTYYLMIIVGSVLVVLDQVFSLRKAKKNPELNSSSE